MVHAGGRPRKVREEEFCPNCGLKGYSRVVTSWTPRYKDTSKNDYRRFRHDDRTKRDCYIETAAKIQEAELLADHPLKEMVELIVMYSDFTRLYSKMWRKTAHAVKAWPLTKEEDRRAHEAFKFAEPLMKASLTHLRMVLMLFNYIKMGQDMPEKQKKAFEEMQSLLNFDNPEQAIDHFMGPLYQVMSELDAKYGALQRKAKRKQKKEKQLAARWDI